MNSRNKYIEEIIDFKVKYEKVEDIKMLRKALRGQSNKYVYDLLFEVRRQKEIEEELKRHNKEFIAESFDPYDFM